MGRTRCAGPPRDSSPHSADVSHRWQHDHRLASAQHPTRQSRYRGWVRIAIALFEGAEELDFAGPWEVLSYWAREVARAQVEVFTVAETLDPVRAAKGLRVLPDHAWPD